MPRRTVADFAGKYAGAHIAIVGKGQTRFDPANLSDLAGPVIFLNEAVQWEALAYRAEARFAFAHDLTMAQLADRYRASTWVVARADAWDRGKRRPMFTASDLPQDVDVATYEWGGWYTEAQLAALTRQDLAETRRLYLNSGTIHSAIHFAWLCGAERINFIGCDGFSRDGSPGYNPSIHAISSPGGSYAKIRAVADRACEILGVQTEYIHEPGLQKVIPAIAHFVWLGSDLPAWARANIEAFQALQPGWRIALWREVPTDMPDDLYRIAHDVAQWCTRKDILSYWALRREGGVYIDCDVVPLRSFEPLRRYRGFAARQHDGRINCAVMGSVPQSPWTGACLSRIREIARNGLVGHHRAVFGPNMLTELFGGEDGRDARAHRIDILPEHYFYPYIDGKQAAEWIALPAEKRQAELAAHAARVQSDPVAPYAVHLWGVDGSSKRHTFGRGDALVARLRLIFGDSPEEATLGAEVGVLAGKLSEHVLRELPATHLLMVDRWRAADPDSLYARSGDSAAAMSTEAMEGNMEHARQRTEFASARRQLLRGESAQVAASVPDGSLDYVFIDAEHTFEGLSSDLAAWWPKVRAGGLVCGHDIDNPLGGCTFTNPNWGVRKALESFLREHGIDPETSIDLGGEYTWFLQKPAAEAAANQADRREAL